MRGRSVSLRASSSVTVEARRRRRRASARSGARPSLDAIFSGVTDGRSRPTRGLGSIAQAKWHVAANKKRRSKSIEIQANVLFFSSVFFHNQKEGNRSIETEETHPRESFCVKAAHTTDNPRIIRYYAYIVSVHACHAPPLRAFDDLPPLAHDHQRAHHRPLVDAQTREVLREVPLTRCRADGEFLLDLRLD